MKPEHAEAAYSCVAAILAETCGEDSAITISTLCRATSVCRREMEELLQLRIDDFPFLVVSTYRGYFRPASAKEIEQCLAALHSRAVKILLRKRTIVRKAVAHGWARQGLRFARRLPADEKEFNAPAEARAARRLGPEVGTEHSKGG